MLLPCGSANARRMIVQALLIYLGTCATKRRNDAARASGIAAIAMFTAPAPMEDEASISPWLDMPQFEEISL